MVSMGMGQANQVPHKAGIEEGPVKEMIILVIRQKSAEIDRWLVTSSECPS